MDNQEFLNWVCEYLNEKGKWFDFLSYMEKQGYEIKELPFPFSESGD
jgi:hypothetical protein